MTQFENHEVPQSSYEQVKQEFPEQKLAALKLAVVEINRWNRIAISFHAVPGSYCVGQHG